ncbi:MAG: hypothetical protein GY720_22910 [bacterium]|nr:hypothetical protein [bacterium]
MKPVIHDPEVLERMQMAFELYEVAEVMKRQNTRRRHPDQPLKEPLKVPATSVAGRAPRSRGTSSRPALHGIQPIEPAERLLITSSVERATRESGETAGPCRRLT